MSYLLTLDQTPQEVTLQEILIRSAYTILYFYPKDDTPWCTLEAIDFSSLLDELKNYWVQVIGVSKDSHEEHCLFQKKHWLWIALLTDAELILHKTYGAWGEKNNYWKIVTGVIRSTFLLNQEWKIIKDRVNIKATGHAKRVFLYIQEHIAHLT